MPTNRSTDAAWIYFIETEDRRHVKIGRSRNVIQRFYTLQVGNPGLRLLGVLPEIPGSTEAEVHLQFAADHHEGEWFHNSARIGEFIKSLQYVQLPPRVTRNSLKKPVAKKNEQSWLSLEIAKVASRLPPNLPIGRQKTKNLSQVCYEDLERYLKVLNQEDREKHQKRIAAVKSLMDLWPRRTKKTHGVTLAEVDATKARAAGLIE